MKRKLESTVVPDVLESTVVPTVLEETKEIIEEPASPTIEGTVASILERLDHLEADIKEIKVRLGGGVAPNM